MPRTIFVAPVGSDVGKTTFCLGLIFSLKKIATRIGFMKPVGQKYNEDSGVCEDIQLIAEVCDLDSDIANMCTIGVESLEKRLLAGQEKQVLDNIAADHEKISEMKQVVVIEGMDLTSIGFCQTDLNVSVAERLDAQILLLVGGAKGRPIEEIVYETVRAKQMYEAPGCRVLGVVVNKAAADTLADYTDRLSTAFKEHSIDVIGVLPQLPVMASPSMCDITEAIGGSVVIKGDMRRLAYDVIVGAMRPANMLKYLGENSLVITPGDREDILLCVAVADVSSTFHSIAGIILTGNMKPSGVILSLIRNLRTSGFPVILAKEDTFKTAALINRMKIHIRGDDKEKIETAAMIVDSYCDCNGLFAASGMITARQKKPQDYLDELIRSARKKTMHIVLPEGADERVIRAAGRICKLGIARLTLLGDPALIRERAAKLDVSLHKMGVLDPASADVEAYADQLYRLRRDKGMGIYTARDLLSDATWYGIMMVHSGDADGFVSGAIHSTADTLRPALQVIGMAPGVRFVSSVFLMLKDSKAFFYGDCAIIEEPDKEQLATIAVSSARTAESFGVTPVVAMLSYSTGRSSKGSSVEKVREAAKMAAKMAADIPIEGPVQYDAAFDETVARLKLPESKVAGHANVFIFPDLNSGNIAYKAVQREAGAMAIGPICQGFRKPVNDLSRGCSVEDIVYLTAITSIQAQQMELNSKPFAE